MCGNGQWKPTTPTVVLSEGAITTIPGLTFQRLFAATAIQAIPTATSVFVSHFICRSECFENQNLKI